jgi:hypothetical protein
LAHAGLTAQPARLAHFWKPVNLLLLTCGLLVGSRLAAIRRGSPPARAMRCITCRSKDSVCPGRPLPLYAALARGLAIKSSKKSSCAMCASAISVIVAGEHAMKVRIGNMAPPKSCAPNGLSPVWRHPIRAWRHKKRCADNTIAHNGAIALSCLTNRASIVNAHLRSFTICCSRPVPLALCTTGRVRLSAVAQSHRPGGVHALLRVRHSGRRMLSIRFEQGGPSTHSALILEGR